MWTDTAITRRLGIAAPIIQGPFGGGLSSVKLAAAVSNTGGLGSYGANALDGQQIKDLVAALRKATDKPFAVNLWVNDQPVALPDKAAFAQFQAFFEPYYRELDIETPAQPVRFAPDYMMQIEAALEARPPVLSFVFGCPDSAIVEACRARGIVTIGTATTPDEARALEAAGIDARDAVWQHPDLLPSSADLDEPAGFIDRVIGGDVGGIDIDAVIAEFEKDVHESGSDEPEGPVDS
jgi:nitronate monooxygenase